jgi:hypothetical protein
MGSPTTPQYNLYSDRIDILRVTFGPTITLSRADSWSQIIREVRVQERKSFARTLCLEQWIQYVTMCLLAKIWFFAQILLPTRIHTQQLTSTCKWYKWQTSIFRVPITTLQRSKHEGGWNLPNIELKCRTLLPNRIHILGATDGTVMAQLFFTWAIRICLPNAPQVDRIPKQLEHLQQYAIDMAYIPPPTQTDNRHIFKRRIFSTILQLSMNNNPDCEMRITRKKSCRSLEAHMTKPPYHWTSRPIKSTWYAAIQDTLPTHNRLAEIHLEPMNTCPRCNNPDCVIHGITDCGDDPIK